MVNKLTWPGSERKPFLISLYYRGGWDQGECGPEAAGHGGGETAEGEGAGEPGGTAETVHSQEPDHRLRNTVTFVCVW